MNNYILFHFHQDLSLNFGLKSVVSLDLKTFCNLNRKKKKNKEKKKLEEAAAESMAKGSNQEKQNSASEDTRTPAQKAYDKIQEKRVNLLLSLFSYLHPSVAHVAHQALVGLRLGPRDFSHAFLARRSLQAFLDPVPCGGTHRPGRNGLGAGHEQRYEKG